jgi:hypothetical protein
MDEKKDQSTAAAWAPIVVTFIGGLLLLWYLTRWPW